VSGRLLISLAVAGALLVAAAAGAGAAGPTIGDVGALTRLPGKAGCVADTSQRPRDCTSARALRGPAPFLGSHAVAISPDGRNLYVAASKSDAITIFDRDPRTGALTQPAGAGGCVAADTASGCARAVGLRGPNSVAVSPDGRNLYATARTPGSIVAFTRNRTTGTLTQISDGGCIAVVTLPGCAAGRGLAAADAVAVSPDGRSVYAAAFAGNAIAAFARNASTGALTQSPGAAGCLVNEPADGCATGLALASPEGLAVSPDGTSVYVASALSNSLVALRRDASTGALTQPSGASGCLVTPAMPGCGAARALGGANAVAISRDGVSVYVTSVLSGAVAALTRDTSTGTTRELPGTGGCASSKKLTRCAAGQALRSPEGLAVSPDGATVYVASFASDAIGVFARNRASGTITQLPGRSGCLSAAGRPCTAVSTLNGVSSIAVSPDGRNVYAAAFNSSVVTVFRRATG